MNYIDTSIEIDAPAATVWAALTDFEGYSEWNPRSRITGVATPGERLVVAPGPEAEGMPTFRPRVLAGGPVGKRERVSEHDERVSEHDERVSEHDERVSEHDGPLGVDGSSGSFELRWLGHLWVRGLFDGEHSFRVESLGAGRSRLTQSESFSGLLAGILLRRYGADTEAGFHAVNEALKARAEALAAVEDSGADGGADGRATAELPGA